MGADALATAQAAAQIGVAAVAAGASDVTRGVDAVAVASRVAQLSEVVGAAGVADIAQGAELLAASEDIETMAAVVGLLSVDDLDRGMELARISGELAVAGEVVSRIGMPVLSSFLADRAAQLQDAAVETTLRMASTRALAEMMAASGAKVGALGKNEATEGIVRVAVAGKAAAASEVMAAAGVELVARGEDALTSVAAAAAADWGRWRAPLPASASPRWPPAPPRPLGTCG
jgi:hypothetical protein